MPQYKHNAFFRPFQSPAADDDEDDLYNLAYYAKFPTHFQKRIRLVAQTTDTGGLGSLLQYPGLFGQLDVYLNDGKTMRWSCQHEIAGSPWKVLRICDSPAYTYHWRIQMWNGAAFVAQTVYGPYDVRTVGPERANYRHYPFTESVVDPVAPFTNYAGDFLLWEVQAGKLYPPPDHEYDWWDEFW